MSVQLAKVTKPLGAVIEMTRKNKRVVFDSDGSYMEDKNAGEAHYFTEEPDGWALELWMHEPATDEEALPTQSVGFQGQEVVDV